MLGLIIIGVIVIFATNRLLVSISNQYLQTFKRGLSFTSMCKYRQKYLYSSIYILNGLGIIWRNEIHTWLIIHVTYGAIFLGIALAVVFNCGTIKLVNTMVMPFYLMMPIGSVLTGILIIFLLGYACEMHEKSSVALVYLHKLVVSKYELKYLKSMSPFGCPFGGFCVLQKCNRLAFYDANPNYTITLLVIL